MHDPELYPDPYEFRPERFIRDGKLDFSTSPDPMEFVFGFGRRYVAKTVLNVHTPMTSSLNPSSGGEM